MISFAVLLKLLSLIRSRSLIFAFICITLEERPKNNIAMVHVKEYSPYVFLL